MNTKSAASLPLIPLAQLRLSPRNARKTEGAAPHDLAASIAATGYLLQNLTVLRATDGYEVIAGGRRLAALQLLQERGELPIALRAGVPCLVIEDAGDAALEASAAENMLRERMHPADEFDAFKTMVDSGKPIPDVAAHFGVPEIVVKQRLKLANVAPDLVDLYRKGGIELEQLQALAITDDHEAQRTVWEAAGEWNRNASALRRALTHAECSASSSLARFVGVDTYVAAGGDVRHDLFGGPEDAWLTDRKLLDNLAQAKLDAIAQQLRDTGWSWARTAMVMDYDQLKSYPALPSPGGDDEFATPEDAARATVIEARIAELEAMSQEQDDEDDALQDEYSSLIDEHEAIQGRMVEVWPDDAKAAAGALVYLDNGDLQIELGRLLPGQHVNEIGKAAGKAKTTKAEKPAKPKKPELSAAVLLTLSAHRNARAKAIIACNPMLGLCLLLDRLLASHRANHGGVSNCTGIGHVPSGGQPTPAGVQISKKLTEALKLAQEVAFRGMPRKDVLPWLMKQPVPALLDILSVLVSDRFNAVTDRPNGHDMVSAIDTLIDEPGFINLADHWSPTTDDFLGRIHADLVAEAVTEAVGKDAASKLRSMKKAERTATAAKLLAGTGWLPKPLRSPGYAITGANSKPTPATSSKTPKKPQKKSPAKKSGNVGVKAPAAKKAPAKAAKRPAKKAKKS